MCKKENAVSEQATRDAFYIVLRDKSSSYVSHRHTTWDSAYNEAQRLAKKENASFYILMATTKIECIQSIVTYPVAWNVPVQPEE